MLEIELGDATKSLATVVWPLLSSLVFLELTGLIRRSLLPFID